DALRARCGVIAKAKWAASPETAAFDQALLFGSIDGAAMPKFPQPYLARGKRLAELGRLDEAETAFNRAVELRPDDPDVLAARAVFLADSGKPERAAADFDVALNLIGLKNPQWRCGQPVMQQAVQRNDVFEHLVKLRPLDTELVFHRCVFHVWDGKMAEAQA